MQQRGIYTHSAGRSNRQKQQQATPAWLRLTLHFILSLIIASVLMVLLLRWFSPPTTSAILQDRLLYKSYADYRWMPLESISPKMRLAVIAAEDPDFIPHAAVDDRLLARTRQEFDYIQPLTRGRSLTQQVVRNLFLWEGDGVVVNNLETYFTTLVNLLWNEERVLEVYLNTMDFGNGLYGVEAASQRYYRHSATRLGMEKASRLAAILPDPDMLSLLNPNSVVEERSEWIQDQMLLMDEDQYFQLNRQ